MRGLVEGLTLVVALLSCTTAGRTAVEAAPPDSPGAGQWRPNTASEPMFPGELTLQRLDQLAQERGVNALGRRIVQVMPLEALLKLEVIEPFRESRGDQSLANRRHMHPLDYVPFFQLFVALHAEPLPVDIRIELPVGSHYMAPESVEQFSQQSDIHIAYARIARPRARVSLRDDLEDAVFVEFFEQVDVDGDGKGDRPSCWRIIE